MEDPAIWNTPDKAQELGRERSRLENVVDTVDRITNGLKDAGEILTMAVEENDESAVAEVERRVVEQDPHVRGVPRRRGAARRVVNEGGAYVNNQRVADPAAVPDRSELLAGRWLLLRRGKRNLAVAEVRA